MKKHLSDIHFTQTSDIYLIIRKPLKYYLLEV